MGLFKEPSSCAVCEKSTYSKTHLCVEHQQEALRVMTYIGMVKEGVLKADDLAN
jgi:hypothetical protein